MMHLQVTPRDVYAPVVSRRAAAVVLAHNHPSGNPEPWRPRSRISAFWTTPSRTSWLAAGAARPSTEEELNAVLTEVRRTEAAIEDQHATPTPAALADIRAMLAEGLDERAIRRMACDNPCALLGLVPESAT